MESLKSQLLRKSQSGAETLLLKEQEMNRLKKEMEDQKIMFEKVRKK